MHKKVYGKKLSRGAGARKALMRSQIKALVSHGSITTTKAKAQYTQSGVDEVVNLAKKNTLSSRRKLVAILGNDKKTADQLVKMVAPSFKKRNGGYTKIVRLPNRRGDAAQMADLKWGKEIATGELVNNGKGKEKSVKKKVVAKKASVGSKAVSKVTKRFSRKKKE